jgi:hypothetical protein
MYPLPSPSMGATMDIDAKINSLVFDGPNQLGYARQ